MKCYCRPTSQWEERGGRTFTGPPCTFNGRQADEWAWQVMSDYWRATGRHVRTLSDLCRSTEMDLRHAGVTTSASHITAHAVGRRSICCRRCRRGGSPDWSPATDNRRKDFRPGHVTSLPRDLWTRWGKAHMRLCRQEVAHRKLSVRRNDFMYFMLFAR